MICGDNRLPSLPWIGLRGSPVSLARVHPLLSPTDPLPSGVVLQAPESVLESENWSAFCAGLDRVLDVFSAQPLVSGGTSSQWSESSVKYLTSSKLIGLQLQDPSFRRQFMVQCLILFRFARDPVIGKEKKAGLSSQQLEQAAAMEKKVDALAGCGHKVSCGYCTRLGC